MEKTYNISNHAKQRYAERIMGKDDKTDVLIGEHSVLCHQKPAF